jgi:hypothetical protein
MGPRDLPNEDVVTFATNRWQAKCIGFRCSKRDAGTSQANLSTAQGHALYREYCNWSCFRLNNLSYKIHNQTAEPWAIHPDPRSILSTSRAYCRLLLLCLTLQPWRWRRYARTKLRAVSELKAKGNLTRISEFMFHFSVYVQFRLMLTILLLFIVNHTTYFDLIGHNQEKSLCA